MTTATKTMLERRDEVREWTIRKGWRGVNAPSRTFGDDMSLLHSEVSEMLEAYRTNKLDRWSVWDDGWTVGGESEHSVEKGTFDYHNAKPEGVASELADTLIRLLDNYAEWRVQPPEGEVEWIDEEKFKSFGDATDYLHNLISNCSQAVEAYSEMSATFLQEIIGDRFDAILVGIQIVSKFYELDLEEEYEAKMKYNETREHRHGGKNL